MDYVSIQTTMQNDQSPKLYDIDISPLLAKYTPQGLDLSMGFIRDKVYEQVATEIIARVRNGEIWFPYHKYFKGNPDQLFNNLKIIDLETREGSYKLYSYYPSYASYLPPLFRNLPVTIQGSRSTKDSVDVLSDHFIEDVRLKSKRYDQPQSILECWEIDTCLKEIIKKALTKEKITPQSMRDSIYESIAETKVFNPTWAKAILKLVLLGATTGQDNNLLVGKKWLDISAGWGDRLLTAMALDMEYTGFDPNIELIKGHSEMIHRFGNPNIHHVIYEPFETAIIPGGPYDVVFTSPPFFTIEEYAHGQFGQSIVSYPKYDQWMVKFLFTSLEKAWNNLKDGGYFILHLGDAKTIITAEAANIFIENYLPGASWEGVIGLQGEGGYARPVWVWKKLPKYEQRRKWEPVPSKVSLQRGPLPSNRRTLYYTYPKLHSELITNYASKYAPYYAIRISSVQAVRAHVSVVFSTTPVDVIDQLLDDNLMISSLLETKQVDEIIPLLSKYLLSYPDNLNIKDFIMQLIPFYEIRMNNAVSIRDYVARNLPDVERKLIDDILGDNLMLSSLIEILGADGTVIWGTAMIKLALHV